MVYVDGTILTLCMAKPSSDDSNNRNPRTQNRHGQSMAPKRVCTEPGNKIGPDWERHIWMKHVANLDTDVHQMGLSLFPATIMFN